LRRFLQKKKIPFCSTPFPGVPFHRQAHRPTANDTSKMPNATVADARAAPRTDAPLSDYMLRQATRLRAILIILVGLCWGLSALPPARDALVMLGQSRNWIGWVLVLAGVVWFSVTVWFWSGFALATAREPFADRVAPSWRRRRLHLRLRRILPLALGFVPYLGLAAGFIGAASAIPHGMLSMMGMGGSGVSVLQEAAVAAVAVGCVQSWWLASLRRAGLPRGGGRRMVLQPLGVAGIAFVALSFVVGALGMAAFGLMPVEAGRMVGPAPAVFFAASGLVCGGTLFTYLGARTRLPILASLFVLLCLLGELRDTDVIADNHDIRVLPRKLRDRPTIEAAFRQFVAVNAKLYPVPEALPVVLVATSGGGLAASYWTGTILGDLADRAPRFRDLLFAVSAVSGGGLGALEAVAMLGEKKLPADCEAMRDCLQKTVSGDFLGPTLGAMLYPDLLQRFLPWPVFEDRAAALEHAWEAQWRDLTGNDRLAGAFLDLWPTDRPWPALLLNATSVRTGAALVTSNLRWFGTDAAAAPHAEDLLGMAGVELPASTAADNGARFPVFGPVGVLRGAHREAGLAAPKELIVDGGYYEDFGATTLMDVINLLHDIAEKNNLHVRFVVIQIIGVPPGDMAVTHNFTTTRGFMGPLATLLRTRDARGMAASASLARRVLELGGVFKPLWLGFSPSGETAPLSWSLSAVARHAIDVQWTKACRDDLIRAMALDAQPAPQSYIQMMSEHSCTLQPP
jgi:FtsH-binding integral membrane protein